MSNIKTDIVNLAYALRNDYVVHPRNLMEISNRDLVMRWYLDFREQTHARVRGLMLDSNKLDSITANENETIIDSNELDVFNRLIAATLEIRTLARHGDTVSSKTILTILEGAYDGE